MFADDGPPISKMTKHISILDSRGPWLETTEDSGSWQFET